MNIRGGEETITACIHLSVVPHTGLSFGDQEKQMIAAIRFSEEEAQFGEKDGDANGFARFTLDDDDEIDEESEVSALKGEAGNEDLGGQYTSLAEMAWLGLSSVLLGGSEYAGSEASFQLKTPGPTETSKLQQAGLQDGAKSAFTRSTAASTVSGQEEGKLNRHGSKATSETSSLRTTTTSHLQQPHYLNATKGHGDFSRATTATSAPSLFDEDDGSEGFSRALTPPVQPATVLKAGKGTSITSMKVPAEDQSSPGGAQNKVLSFWAEYQLEIYTAASMVALAAGKAMASRRG